MSIEYRLQPIRIIPTPEMQNIRLPLPEGTIFLGLSRDNEVFIDCLVPVINFTKGESFGLAAKPYRDYRVEFVSRSMPIIENAIPKQYLGYFEYTHWNQSVDFDRRNVIPGSIIELVHVFISE